MVGAPECDAERVSQHVAKSMIQNSPESKVQGPKSEDGPAKGPSRTGQGTPNAETNPGSHAFMTNKAREVAEFCLRNGQSCFEGWPVPVLFAYAFYHLVDR